MSSPMPEEQSYPSPSAAQVTAAAGPFFGQNGTQPSAPGLPNDLQQLQAVTPSRAAPQHDSATSNGAHHEFNIPGGTHVSEDALRQAASQETLAQHVMNMTNDDQPFHTPDTDDAASRKRSKVSRACDECRRKKIRCDATENSNEPCSNCRRTQARCQFSRTPMKRGPSKGYIKELADKINTLESRLGPSYSSPHDQMYNHYPNDLPSDGVDQRLDYSAQPYLSRKRTHSMSERSGLLYSDHSYAPARSSSANWSGESQRALPNPTTHPQTPTPDASRQQFSPRSGAFRFGAPDSGRRDSIGTPYDPERDAVAAASLEWDESVVDEYYRIIHQTFPLLPHSKLRLRARIANCPPTLREAFLVALDCAIRTSPSTNLAAASDLRQATKRAAELISASQYENATSHSLSTDLVYIQTLVLMALESDNHGPATMRGQVGPPRSEWLGRAIGMATHLRLNVAQPQDRYGEGDPDAEEKMARRVWWILFILDRWHASSTSSLLQLPDNSSSLGPEDQALLGESTYHLVRLSYILGHLSRVLQEPPSLMAPASVAAPIISSTILGEVDRFRESVESLLMGAPNLVHLCYWHVRLLVHRLAPLTTLHELLVPATRMASILNSPKTLLTPLNHHFAALAAMTLVELTDFDETRQDAEKGIDEIVEALTTRKGLMSREDSTGWDSAIRDLITNRRRAQNNSGEAAGGAAGSSAGLQHLADAAIGGKRGGSPSSTTSRPKDGSAGAGFDPTAVTRFGYLAALAQEKPR